MVTVTHNEPTKNIYQPALPLSPITCADLKYGSVCHIQGKFKAFKICTVFHASLPFYTRRNQPSTATSTPASLVSDIYQRTR